MWKFSSDLGEVGLSIVFSQVAEQGAKENKLRTMTGCKLKTRKSEKHRVLGSKIPPTNQQRFCLSLVLKANSKESVAGKKHNFLEISSA